MLPILSFVLPVYNERDNVKNILREIETFHREKMAGHFDLEVLFVDDGSTDGSVQVLKALAEQHDYVRVVIFSRNFGHQAAVSAGYRYARGTAIVGMDSDMQHPVATVEEMVTRWQEGYDVVYAVRDSSQAGLFKSLCSRAFYKIFNLLSQTDILPGGADFRLVSRKVVDALNELPERCRFIRGLIPWLGFSSTKVTYTPRPRASGEPKYSFFKSLGLGITALTSFSIAPLRASLVLGALFMLISIVYISYSIVSWFLGGTLIRGWMSIMALIVLTQGMTLLVFGIQAEYLAKIVMETKRRPEYVVCEVIGQADADAAESVSDIGPEEISGPGGEMPGSSGGASG
ncbi:MAG: glycosyltransferase family 2 protein [Phycisphaerae bacterium]|nr:glycosyltransferase family 2 protein [Phycisphaerae bacterium]